MKKKILNLGIIISSIFAFGSLVLPKTMGEQVFASEVVYTPISDEGALRSISSTGHYKLTDDIELSSDWTPIGTSSSPFSGVLDGDGFTISNLKLSGKSQGLFGYVSGAEIKNLKISGVNYDFTTAPSDSEYFAGAIAGYATDGSVIYNCEVDGANSSTKFTTTENIDYKLTFGGVVGWLGGVATVNGTSTSSTISNVAVYDNFAFSEDLKNDFTVKIGGIAGSVNSGAKVENAVCFSNISINDISESNNLGTTYVGEIAGEVSGNETRIFNTVSSGSVSVDVKGVSYKGSVIGCLNLVPMSGNLSNIAYSQSIDFIGKESLYTAKNSSTNDYVANLPIISFSDQRLYFDNQYIYNPTENQQKIFMWYDLSNGFEDSIWCMNLSSSKSELRLQRFQNFSISISTQVDNQNLLKNTTSSTKTSFGYGDVAEFSLKLDDSNVGFYEIDKIYVNGNQIDYQILNNKSDEMTNDVALYKTESGYGLKVRSKSYTSGSFSFELVANAFEGRVYVKDSIGGSVVRFAGATNKRTFTKSSTATSAEAKAGSMYIFKNWVLYYQTSQAEAVNNNELREGYIEVDNLYWKKISPVYSSYDSENNFKYATSSLAFKFGENLTTFVMYNGDRNLRYLDQTFLLEAVFEEDPYKITFNRANDFAVKNVEKVVVNNTDISTTNNVAVVGKSDVIVIDVYVLSGYELSVETMLNSIRNDKLQPSVTTRDDVYENGKIYSFEFNTNKLDSSKMDSSEHNKFSFVLVANEEIVKNENPNLLWIIIGSSVGGVILIGVVIFIIVKVVGGRGGSSGSSGGSGKSEKPTKSSVNNDYKRYYL